MLPPKNYCAILPVQAQFRHDKIGDRGGFIQVEHRHVDLQFGIAGHRPELRVVLGPATDQFFAVGVPEQFDFRQAAVFKSFDQNQIDIRKIVAEQLYDRR